MDVSSVLILTALYLFLGNMLFWGFYDDGCNGQRLIRFLFDDVPRPAAVVAAVAISSFSGILVLLLIVRSVSTFVWLCVKSVFPGIAFWFRFFRNRITGYPAKKPPERSGNTEEGVYR